MRFEVVPGFENTDSSFTYPDSNGGGKWKITNPRPEIASIKNNNILTKGNLVNLCRMTRAWKKYWDVPIGGLLIDTLACKFLRSWADKKNLIITMTGWLEIFLNIWQTITPNRSIGEPLVVSSLYGGKDFLYIRQSAVLIFP